MKKKQLHRTLACSEERLHETAEALILRTNQALALDRALRQHHDREIDRDEKRNKNKYADSALMVQTLTALNNFNSNEVMRKFSDVLTLGIREMEKLNAAD